jgi:hypothetical protein
VLARSVSDAGRAVRHDPAAGDRGAEALVALSSTPVSSRTRAAAAFEGENEDEFGASVCRRESAPTGWERHEKRECEGWRSSTRCATVLSVRRERDPLGGSHRCAARGSYPRGLARIRAGLNAKAGAWER